MTQEAKNVFSAALGLSRKDRVSLARRLIESLEPEQIQIDPAWRKEIRRRIKEFDTGKAEVLALDDLLRSLPHRKKS